MRHVFAIFAIFILSIYSFLPFLAHPATTITDPADAVLTVWIIRRVQDNLLAGRSLFDSNLFYPHQNSILFSDTFITTAILSLPLRLVTQEPLPFFSLSMMDLRS
jgi:hypothetical protein